MALKYLSGLKSRSKQWYIMSGLVLNSGYHAEFSPEEMLLNSAPKSSNSMGPKLG